MDPLACDWAVAVPLTELPPPADLPVRILAFYLPQYHPIPENDEWWGKGFTEWRNVIRGRPRFVGHYQPHLPGELGFYDLRVPEVQARQVELARLYGIAGFVFYFYWFDGRRLLERPLLNYLGDTKLDLPFCLCWANESWSRRWDGREQDVLVAQAHSAEDDLAFIGYVAAYLRDSRYIRVGGRPLLLVYRPDLLPDPRATAERWRRWCREQGVGDLFIAYTQSFEATDPEVYGFDAAVEFPPNNTAPQDISEELELLDPEFGGVIYDWRVYPERSRAYRDPGYRLFRGVNPGWDNEARRPGRGATFYGSSPTGYREWLENAIGDTLARFPDAEERLVFVNAWNEWAEGAHLEPDQRYGYAYLEATRDALVATRQRWRRTLLLVCHDARPHGAQLLALSLARELREGLGYRVHMAVLGPGPLLREYAKYADVRLLDVEEMGTKGIDAYVAGLPALGVKQAIVNSTASAACIPALKAAGIEVIGLVHELPELIRTHGLTRHAKIMATQADHVVFPAQVVHDGFGRFGAVPAQRARIRPQGLYKRNRFKRNERDKARLDLRRRLRLDPSAQVVLGVGFGDHRKGFDLYVDAGLQVCSAQDRAVFVWIGMLDPSLEAEALERIDRAGMLSRFVFPGHEPDTDPFYAGADVYAMTSREDPFPSVVLEALDAGLPVVGFDGAGGFASLGPTGCVELAAPFDVGAYARAVGALLRDDDRRARIATTAQELIQREFGFRRYVFELVGLVADAPPKVSVVVPNFNYCHYLAERLRSIAEQTMPVYEVIVLDDASSDGSQQWLESELRTLLPDAQLIVNTCNSGSVFEQWRRGVELARGDYVWIAEADDLAEADFLAEAVPGLSDPEVVLSYTQSKQIDEAGEVLAEDYHEYVSDISTCKWRHAYVADGEEEIRTCLAVKNTIPNVSAVVFRRDVVAGVLRRSVDELKTYRVAGDWVTYIEVLGHGRIAFCPKALNRHRRHRSGVTISGFGRAQLREILSVQRRVGETYAPAAEVRAAALAYAERLYQQFELATQDKPSLGADPELASLIGAGEAVTGGSK
jgi:glycosyltransferase involved in cell wall biosynthesis/GT2 family glycosyltransferase